MDKNDISRLQPGPRDLGDGIERGVRLYLVDCGEDRSNIDKKHAKDKNQLSHIKFKLELREVEKRQLSSVQTVLIQD